MQENTDTKAAPPAAVSVYTIKTDEVGNYREFVARTQAHQEAEINSVMNGMNAVDHSDQSCLIGVFCQVIKKIHGYKSDVDVTQLAGMYLDLYRRTINLLDEDRGAEIDGGRQENDQLRKGLRLDTLNVDYTDKPGQIYPRPNIYFGP